MRMVNIIPLLIVCTCCCINTIAQQPNVFVLDANRLLDNKNKVKANDVAVSRAYKELIKDANAALQFGPVSVMEKKHIPPSGDKHDYMSLAPYHWPDPTKPNGLPYIRKDGQTNPEVKEYKDKEYMPLLCSNVYQLALAYFFSKDEKYAAHAARLLRVWFLDTATRMNPNINFGQAIKGENTGRGAGIIDARHFIKVADAIGLLQHSKYWTAKDQQGMKTWFTEFLNWLHTSDNGIHEMNTKNNHGAWYDALRLSLSLFTNNMELAKKIIGSAQDRLDKQMDENGNFPAEMARTTSFHYSVFVMDAFFNIAAMAEKIGIDLWNYTSSSGKSLKKGFEQLRPYLSQQQKWHGQQIKEFDYKEGYYLISVAYLKFGCKDCRQVIKNLEGDKQKLLLLNLLY